MFKKFLAVGLLAGSLAIGLASPAVAVTAVLPVQSCADVHLNNPSAADGIYTIYPNKHIISVYCYDMAGTPREYLALPNSGTGSAYNFSNTYPFLAGGSNLNAAPGGLYTWYTKLRLNVQTMTVDRTDRTFSSSQGYVYYGYSQVTSMDYANAADCNGGGSHLGTGNLDLTGTQFAVAPNQFVAQGWAQAGTADYSANGQIVNLTGGGDCGGMSPTTSALQLTFTGVTDTTAPVITASAKTADSNTYTSGAWTNQNVTVQFTCSDADSGVALCQAASTVSTEGANQSVSGTATDNAGNTASATFSGIDIDKTAPTVTFSGNAVTYTVDQTVNITCAAADALSGVASTTCKPVSGPAYSFVLGSNSFSASATDKAGNTGSASTSFTVVDNTAGLSNLIGQFVTDPGVAQSMQSQVGSIASAPNANAKAGKLDAFSHFLSAQTGKSLSAQQAAILLRLASAL